MRIYRKLYFSILNIKSKLRIWHLKLLYGKAISFGKKVQIGKNFQCVINPHHASLRIGSGVTIRDFCSFRVENGAELNISDGVFFNNFCSVTSMQKIAIGENTIIGEGVRLYDHNHQHSKSGDVKIQGYTKGEIIIEKNVWIGSNTIVLKDVQVKENVIIGAGNIVFKSIPANMVVINNQDKITNERK